MPEEVGKIIERVATPAEAVHERREAAVRPAGLRLCPVSIHEWDRSVPLAWLGPGVRHAALKVRLDLLENAIGDP
jgi:hypothetical protein